jgi:pyruvate ferredoxin oxidoreductase alpha subunit
MLEQLEGSRAVARTVALCRPQVIPAYPISPQTHIVEALSAMVAAGELSPCEFINVESEYAAMSVAIGASATGARAYTATASQGLLYMAEALYNASGLGLPIVMTVANRALGAPINIWNDHSDSMSQRDSGWIQLYVESNQEALDTHVLAFRLAEELSTPVMVCMDGFILTHAVERLDMPTQATVDSYLPPYEPRQVLDPDEPLSIGAMVGPEAFTEVKYLAHLKHMQALDLIPELAAELGQALGREPVGLLRSYRARDADTVVVALGSVLGTIEDAVDELRAQGVSVGAVGVKAFRPFPLGEVRAALRHAKCVIVLEKALAVGLGGIVSQNVCIALEGTSGDHTAPGTSGAGQGTSGDRPAPVHTVIAGLGGRPITQSALVRLLAESPDGGLPQMSFLDLNRDLVERELARTRERRRSGPHAENMLRDVGAIAAGPV